MGLFRKGQKAYSILNLTCPRCHEASMWYTGSFSFKKSFDMKPVCDHCGQNLEPEPGFYYGAMFISYIFTAWLSIFFVIFFHWVLDLSLEVSFVLLILFMAFCFVYFFRLARSIWININIKYDPTQAKG
ncbi:MAG: DUF983 domain-containing protein [Lewinella sp.]|nr:DUF983 domain-containing protein [Lewinella sp.]